MPPDRPGRLLQQARDALSDRRLEEALDRTTRAAATMPRMVEVLLVRAAALLDGGEAALALAYLDTALDLDPTNGDVSVERCRALIESSHLKEAVAELAELAETYPDDPEILFLKATAADLVGQYARADRLYRQAARLDPVRYPEPARVPTTSLIAAARRAIAELPEDVRERLKEVDVRVLPVPAPELLAGADPPLPQTLLGLFMGATLRERKSLDVLAPEPTRIFLFQRNIERGVTGADELEEQVRITVLHEIGHFLELNEADLEERGLD